MTTNDRFIVARSFHTGLYMRFNDSLMREFDGELYEAKCWYHSTKEQIQNLLTENDLHQDYELVVMGPIDDD